MTLDTRRELDHVFKELRRFHGKVGEAVIWFRFDLESSYDRVYDEGFKNYQSGVAVPVLWIDQQEDPKSYSAEGRRPTQRIRFSVSALSLANCGISPTEAHGGRLWDVKPYGKPWWDDRLNDLLYYDGRFWEISDFQIRGRARADMIVSIGGIETQPADDRIFDLFPVAPLPVYEPEALTFTNGAPVLLTDNQTVLGQETPDG